MNSFDKVKETSYIFARADDPFFGSVTVSGAKNMVTKIMSASLLAQEGKLVIKNIPLIGEVLITLRLFDQLGVRYKINSNKTLEIEPKAFGSSKIKFESEEGNRISLLLAGPILAQFGQATIAKPKGCNIGLRKIDFHLKGLQRFGVKIKEDQNFLYLKLGKNGLKGNHFRLPFPSVGATENLLITAACARGESIIDNCAIEPEITELIKFLQKGGIEIIVHGDRSIYVKGKKEIKLSEVTIIPDRVETVSLAAAVLATKGDVFLENARQDLIISALGVLEKMGAGIEIKENGIRFYYRGQLKPIRITTEVYPGLATDYQQPIAILLSQIKGKSFIHETIFENRFGYLEALNPLIRNNSPFKIGTGCPAKEKCRFANQKHRHLAKISGPVKFGSGKIIVPDLRAGFALLIAACLSDGIKVYNPKLILRGYENPVGKLKSLGANIELKI